MISEKKQLDMKSLLHELKMSSDNQQPKTTTIQSRKLWRVPLAVCFLFAVGAILTSYYRDQATTIEETVDIVDSKPPVSPTPTFTDNALTASGYLIPLNSALIGAEISGKINTLYVREGDHIEKGQVIAMLDAKSQLAEVELVKAQLLFQQEVVAKIRSELEQASVELGRSRELKEKQLTSNQSLEQTRLKYDLLKHQLKLESLQANVIEKSLDIRIKELDKTAVKSPFTGVISEILTKEGEFTTPVYSTTGTSNGIVKILSVNNLLGEIFINEKHIDKVYQGQKVSLTPIAYPEVIVAGKVERIIPIVRKESSTLKVIISGLENPEALLPNMRIDVNFKSSQHTKLRN